MWGKEGYLVQREAVEEAAQVEVPSPLRSPNQQADADSPHSQTPSTTTPTPEPEQEKQQLASSLFFGLSSQSSVCLVSSQALLYELRLFVQGGAAQSGEKMPSLIGFLKEEL